MTVRDSVASAYIKNVGQAFQNKIKKQIIDTFSQDFPNCLSNRDDITSCPSCNHGEDIKLSNRFRAIFPVSIECKHRTKEFKLLNGYYDQAVRHTNSLGRTDDIIPILFTKRGTQDSLGVLDSRHLINLFLELALLKKKLQEQS